MRLRRFIVLRLLIGAKSSPEAFSTLCLLALTPTF
jgi:hypothetical protein